MIFFVFAIFICNFAVSESLPMHRHFLILHSFVLLAISTFGQDSLPIVEIKADRTMVYPQRMELTGEETDREALLQAFLKELSKAMEMEPEALSQAYHRRLYRREGMHRFSDSQGEFEAKVLNVLDDGRLVLLDAEGKARMYAFKEVQFVI